MAVSIAYPYYPGFTPTPVPEQATSIEERAIEDANIDRLAQLLSSDIQKYRYVGTDVGLGQDQVTERIRRMIRVVSAQPERIATTTSLVAICLEVIDIGRVLPILEYHLGNRPIKQTIRAILTQSAVPPNEVWTSLNAYKASRMVAAAREGGTALLEPVLFSFLGHLVRHALHQTRGNMPIHDDILHLVAKTTQFFWRTALSWTENPVMREAQDDYVASSMMDGTCLYFSNFFPTGPDMFTRTIFVDLGMSDYERGRMFQRLADILTYRTMAIRDIDRVHLAINCLYELNRELNVVQTALATRDEASKDMVFMSQQMFKIQNVAARVGYLNSFFTYGIAGRFASSESYLQQIRERCDDVRERPISDYPTLREFVDRRLAHSIRNYERMHMHYQTGGRRIIGLMGMIRTSLDTMQADDVSRNLNKQTKAADILTDASNNLMRATDEIGKNLNHQIELHKAAEAIVVIGGTYYYYQIISEVSNVAPGHSILSLLLLLLSLAGCLTARFALIPAMWWVRILLGRK